ncbi:keratinocyte differentiation factor 1 [Betta splendens]|uniref:Keratinocyte differentiation factor 1 n=1 Tax=Betta splendens TaxID=158456 RepID=A0A6P7NSA6_BETSP|nr:keratinocyte differentiation factor 1 [Betta splendens]XP_029022781.1 keratinocyte differentiation factor 1 [Betta splendens]
MSAGSSGSLRHSSGRCGYARSLSESRSYEERSVDPVEDRTQTPESKTAHKAHLKDANGKESEVVGFISGSADPPSTAQTCNPCTSPASCRTFVCTVMTCGLYRACQGSIVSPCLAPNESSTDEPEKVSLQASNPKDNKKEDDSTDWLEDIRIAGVKVNHPRDYLVSETETPSYVSQTGGHAQPSRLSLHESMSFDDWEDGDGDVDSLITKKLLELYSEYQIEELARCTSDSVFLRKSKDINQLINSLAEEHKMDEQEAECRLVRGIIRISTRKSKKRPPISKMEWTLSDSGNETMKESVSSSFSNNNDYKSHPNIQISEQTSSDKCARDIWRNNGGHNSISPTASSPTETNSSGVPLIRSSVRT